MLPERTPPVALNHSVLAFSINQTSQERIGRDRHHLKDTGHWVLEAQPKENNGRAPEIPIMI